MRVSGRLAPVGLVAALLVAGCSKEDQRPGPLGAQRASSALAIAAVRAEETASRSSVVAFDAAGGEVGRLELIHGPFTLSEEFREESQALEVDGRKLDVSVLGDRLVWETAGYEPVLQLPAHPAGHGKLAAFLDDPRVKPVLDTWKIGFAGSPLVEPPITYTVCANQLREAHRVNAAESN